MVAPYAFVVRTKARAKVMASLIRETLKRIDTSQPVNQPLFVADLIRRSF